MTLKNQKEINIANLLDSGHSYSFIEATMNIFPSQIARVTHKIRIIRKLRAIASAGWDLATEIEQVEIEELEKEAILLQEVFRR